MASDEQPRGAVRASGMANCAQMMMTMALPVAEMWFSGGLHTRGMTRQHAEVAASPGSNVHLEDFADLRDGPEP